MNKENRKGNQKEEKKGRGKYRTIVEQINNTYLNPKDRELALLADYMTKARKGDKRRLSLFCDLFFEAKKQSNITGVDGEFKIKVEKKKNSFVSKTVNGYNEKNENFNQLYHSLIGRKLNRGGTTNPNAYNTCWIDLQPLTDFSDENFPFNPIVNNSFYRIFWVKENIAENKWREIRKQYIKDKTIKEFDNKQEEKFEKWDKSFTSTLALKKKLCDYLQDSNNLMNFFQKLNVAGQQNNFANYSDLLEMVLIAERIKFEFASPEWILKEKKDFFSRILPKKVYKKLVNAWKNNKSVKHIIQKEHSNFEKFHQENKNFAETFKTLLPGMDVAKFNTEEKFKIYDQLLYRLYSAIIDGKNDGFLF